MDLTDEQWEILEPLIPTPPRREDGRGRPWRDPRDVLNGILWILRTVEHPGSDRTPLSGSPAISVRAEFGAKGC